MTIDLLAVGDFPVLDAIRVLSGEIAARAAEIENARVLPADIADRLCEAGLFRMIVPRAYGGAELSPLQFSRVLEELGRADGSTAWTGAIAVGINAALGHLPRATLDRLYAKTPNVLARGSFAPKGTATPTEGGYRLNGKWSLASGTAQCNWVIANGLVTVNGTPHLGAFGIPETRMALLPVDRVRFLDSWDAVGLRASYSHDFVVDDVFVPEEMTGNVLQNSNFETSFHRLLFVAIISPGHASVAVGIAQGALDDLAALARAKRPALDPTLTLSQNPVFNFRFGELIVRLRAMRAFLEKSMQDIWDIAKSDAISEAEIAGTAAMTAYIHMQCADIVSEAMALAGTNACYNSMSLQRRWRDMRVVARHIAANPQSYERVGATANPPNEK